MTDIDPHAAASDWLGQFDTALARADFAAAAALFHADGHWRDLLAFTWDLRTFDGAAAIAAALRASAAHTAPTGFALDETRTGPRRVRRAGTDAIEAIFRFETAAGTASGVVRLTAGPGGMRAWILLTALEELRGFEERTGARRPKGESYSRNFGGENWLDHRTRERAYADRDPAVLVVGGGQAGLAIAARLGQLGVDTLIVDRMQRVGDNWRNRYHSLTLHNQVWVNHLPYMPFPPSWPTYIPKDKLANWFEAYVEAMELNFWTGTEFVGGTYDAQAQCWSVLVRRADGTERTMRPRHVVLATSVSGIPSRPPLPGLEDFAGTVVHSGAYTEGSAWQGRNALVIGTGNSGHDVAQDLHSHGARTIIVQRSATNVASIEPSAQMVYALYEEGPPTEDCDLLAAATPYPVLKRAYQIATAEMAALDKPLIDALAAAGFKTDLGEDGTGFQMRYLQRGGGYYLNVGCSELIIERKIGLVQFADVERFVREGALLRDGTTVAADLIVLATGYQAQQELVRRLFGADVAERVGPVWGFDDAGELRNMFRPTTQAGLWFIAGSLAQCRIYSKYLALQIKARAAGLIAA